MEIVLVHSKEEESLGYIPELITGIIEGNDSDEELEFKSYFTKSGKFLEKRTANSLLSQHGTTNTPLILFRKEGVSVRAVYKEEIKDVSQYDEILINKFLEALEVEVTPVLEQVDEE